MNLISPGRRVMTFALAAGAILSFVLDWSPNHLLNPLWSPHGRLHGALLLFLLAGVSGAAVWLLWRETNEPEIAVRAAALISLSFWTPLFYITTILPGSTSWAGPKETDPRLHGSLVTPNLLVAALFVALSAACFWLSFRKPPNRHG